MSSKNLKQTVDLLDKSNSSCLLIYEALEEAFWQCSELGSRYLNVVGVFYPQLMASLTNYALLKIELESGFVPIVGGGSEVELPFFSHESVSNGLVDVLVPSVENTSNKPAKYRLLEAGSSAVSLGRPAVAINSLNGIEARLIYQKLILGRHRLVFPEMESIWIPSAEQQLKILGRTVEKICGKIDGMGSASARLRKILEDFVQRSLSHKPVSVDFDLLVCGSLNRLSNRKLAAQAREQDKPVISILHGDGDGMIDEPLLGYGERTYATSLLGYSCEHTTPALYNGLFDSEPKYVPSNSNVVMGLYRGPEVRRIIDFDKTRFMYVPTSLSGSQRHEPFRCLPDQLYLDWQKELIRGFNNLIYKHHPKGQKPSINVEKVTTANLKDCLSEADAFVFDHISTAFNIAAATDKPIVYYDIGLRNLTDTAIEKIRDRCIWIDVDWSDPYRSVLSARDVCGQTRRNSYTPSYSLGNRPEVRETTLYRVINEHLT